MKHPIEITPEKENGVSHEGSSSAKEQKNTNPTLQCVGQSPQQRRVEL